MSDARFPDCQPPRHDPDVTSASSHPELLCRELVLPPRVHPLLPSAENTFPQRWPWGALGVAGVLAMAAVLALPIFKSRAADGLEPGAQLRGYLSICAPWDAAASETIVRLVQAKPDIDLQLVSDAIARMRRARRTCEAGWVRLACLDYDAVIRGVPASFDPNPQASMCWPAMLDPLPDIMTRR